MHASWKQVGDRLVFEVNPEPKDVTGPARLTFGSRRLYRLVGGSFELELPAGFDADGLHADLPAAALLILLDQFIGSSISFSQPVSPALRDAYQAASGKRIETVEESLAPRRAGPEARPAIAFSGGTDSTAAAALLPEKTILIQCRRPEGIGSSSHRFDAARDSLDGMAALGFETVRLECGFESILDHHFYMHLCGTAFPAIVLADHYGIDTLAFGHTIDNVYGLLPEYRFIDDPDLRGRRDLGAVLNAVDTPAAYVTAGLTEVGTTIVAERSRFAGVVQSCIRGEKLGEPCSRCAKCFRKQLLGALVAGRDVSGEEILELAANNKVAIELSESPPHTVQTYAYIAARLRGRQEFMDRLAHWLDATESNTAWAERWYEPSAAMLPARYRDQVASRILEYVEPMDAADRRQLHAFSKRRRLSGILKSGSRRRFWRAYEKSTGIATLSATGYMQMEIGESRRIVLKRKYAGRRGRNAGTAARWRSRDRDVASVRKGVVEAHTEGLTIVVAALGNRRVETEINVTGHRQDGGQ